MANLYNRKLLSGVTSYVIMGNDDVINVDTSISAVTIYLPNILSGGFDQTHKQFYINDVGNNASVNKITVVAVGNLVNSGSSVVLDVNGISAECLIVSNTEWLLNLSGDSGGGGGTVPITLNRIPKGTGISIADGEWQFIGTSISPLVNPVLATGWISAPSPCDDGNSLTLPLIGGGFSVYTYDTIDGFFSPTDGTTVDMPAMSIWINKQSNIAVTSYWNSGTNKLELTSKIVGSAGNLLGINTSPIGGWTVSGLTLSGGVTGQDIGDSTHRVSTIYMGSVVDYSSDLAFKNGVNEYMRLTTGGTLGIGTSTPNESALLDIFSTTKGFLPPRMNNSQISLITNPANGLMAYNTELLNYTFYNGTSWKEGLLLQGNYFNNSDKYFGSLDNYSLRVITNNQYRMTFQNTGEVGVGNGTNSLTGEGKFSIWNSDVTPSLQIVSTTSGTSTLIAGNFGTNGRNSYLSQRDGDQGIFTNSFRTGANSFLHYSDTYGLGIGVYTTNVQAKLHVQGTTSDSSAYGLKIENSASIVNFYVRNDGAVSSALGYWINGNKLLHTTGTNNLYLGYNTGINHTTGVENIMIGDGAGYSLTSANDCIAIGFQAMYVNQTASSNTAMGYWSLRNIVRDGNTAIGHYSLPQAGIMDASVAVGYFSAPNATSSSGGVYLGANNSQNLTDGGYNINIGYFTNFANTHAQETIGIGSGHYIYENNTMVVGHYQHPISKAFLGFGQAQKPIDLSSFSLSVAGVLGSNLTGATPVTNGSASASIFYIDGARGTGDQTGGDVVHRVAPKGVSGNSQNALIEILRFRSEGIINISNYPTSNADLSAGDWYVDTSANILANGDKVIGVKQ